MTTYGTSTARVEMTLEGPENLIRHIEHLQETITRRNSEIESLRVEIENLRSGKLDTEEVRKGKEAAYKEGRRRAASEMADLTLSLARELGKVRKDALSVYFSEGVEFDS